MYVRVLSLTDLGRNQEATRTLVGLLEKSGGAEGAELTYNLLTRLNDEFDRARAAGDVAAQRSLATARAELSGYLVTWAAAHPDPKIKELAPRYRVFDAETKRTAAALDPDPASRKAGLERSLALYEQIRGQSGAGGGDVAADLGVAMIQYELGNFSAAQPILARLLNERKLGKPLTEVDDNGVTRLVDNERYWEATLKLMRATLGMVASNEAPATTRDDIAAGLKSLYARWGRGMGGKKFAPEFEKLRVELVPDYVVPDLTAAPADGTTTP
jgi:hypothetical protein